MKKIFNLNKNDLISIVGAGGKTSLMFSLAENLRSDNKVLVTTTTKIFLPRMSQYDFITVGEEEISTSSDLNEKGIHVYGKEINSQNKLIGIDKEVCSKLKNYFDYVLVESDGSKEKPLKGWKECEPVVPTGTNKTIGVFDISTIGKIIDNDLVHNVEEFLNITGASVYENMTIDYAAKLILHEKGLFKNSCGERILFINKVENYEDTLLAYRLKKVIESMNGKYIKLIVAGSAKYNMYKKIDS